ncbi:coiled-coil domain-containing protein 81 [Acanthochromis polyacanthus]|uniref:coiled-coil domain-containing protein 81 n=1 Tax=Acanthochromis polyacanthus TaxID=80966 RepID=UPI00223413C9|nr:coiled-coil domain-containing protein 81 [Acanthochromis polyacanthus]
MSNSLLVVQLNFAAVSQATLFSRDVVQGCIRETLLLLFKALASEKTVFLIFAGIGVLSLKNNKVQMKFNRDFINAMDGTGRLLLAFNNRCGSSVSLLSGGLSRFQRTQTANFITLPTVCSPQSHNKAGDKDGRCSSPVADQRNAGGVPQQREPKSHQTPQPAKMKAVSLSEELNPIPPMEATDKYSTHRDTKNTFIKSQTHTPVIWINCKHKKFLMILHVIQEREQEGGSSLQCVVYSSKESTPAFRPTNSVVPPNLEEYFVNASCTGHTRAGQELCYLCMQRAQRNVPVYLREQQEAAEKAQEKLLLLKEQQRDQEYMEEEQVKVKEQRELAKQVATFNIQISEKKKPDGDMHPNSYIFPARPLTPPRRIQQHRYMNDLQSQIGNRRKHETEDQQKRLLMERLDQVQLIQEIALQKAQQLQQKQEKTRHYKRALDTQARKNFTKLTFKLESLQKMLWKWLSCPCMISVTHSVVSLELKLASLIFPEVEDKKCTETPALQPDNFRFSRCRTAASNTENRERAQKLFQVNFNAATEKKKEELQNRQQQLEKEGEMLRQNKMELILDRINRYEKKRDISKSLEDDWIRSAKLKHKREEEERQFLRSAGQLLVDKLAEYKHCCQCKRRTTNCGETNIWKESHYLSGSQFMI